jgi:hypothetical protein
LVGLAIARVIDFWLLPKHQEHVDKS